MKTVKIIFIFIIGFFITLSVSAREKTFSLIEYKKGLYYDGRYLKEEQFKKEMDLIQDKKYQDTFVIQNNTKKDREVFLLLESVSAEGSYNDIMEYGYLKVMLGDKVLYEGSSSGMDLATNKESLHDFISLGKITKKDSAKIQIELTVSNEYTAKSKNKFAYVTSSFYIQNKDKSFSVIPEATAQMIYNFLDVWVFCGVCVFIGLLFLSIFYIRKHPFKKKNKENKGKEEKEEKDKKKE